ncbi:MAG: aspartate/glutamate racemase family protein [Nitrososphaerota archaeon]|nr:aspartate/glutamate racemase family protein [Aigarchaeota archaeon]MDW8076527.1 aspartate/glutamate racemase family protein [Nitrososphaerota archaeon]
MKIKVIVPVSTDFWNDLIRDAYEKYKDPGTKIDIINIKKGPESVEQIYDDSWSALPTLLELEKAEKEGYDAAIIYCFGDPALLAAKEAVNIPVVGLCEPSIHLASMLGRRFSIIGVGGKAGYGLMIDNVTRYGLSHKMASVRLTDVRVLDIRKEFDKLVEILTEEGRKAIEVDGADTLVLGCGGLLNIADILQERLGVPVIDPGITALKVAELLAKLKLKQSKIAYVSPYPKKRIE